MKPITVSATPATTTTTPAVQFTSTGRTRGVRLREHRDERVEVAPSRCREERVDHCERAALALTESVTRSSDRSDPVPDDVWAEAAGHFEEPQLAALVLAIASINVWNRLNVATRQVAGATW